MYKTLYESPLYLTTENTTIPAESVPIKIYSPNPKVINIKSAVVNNKLN